MWCRRVRWPRPMASRSQLGLVQHRGRLAVAVEHLNTVLEQRANGARLRRRMTKAWPSGWCSLPRRDAASPRTCRRGGGTASVCRCRDGCTARRSGSAWMKQRSTIWWCLAVAWLRRRGDTATGRRVCPRGGAGEGNVEARCSACCRGCSLVRRRRGYGSVVAQSERRGGARPSAARVEQRRKGKGVAVVERWRDRGRLTLVRPTVPPARCRGGASREEKSWRRWMVKQRRARRLWLL
jgi:hypothetical protein